MYIPPIQPTVAQTESAKRVRENKDDSKNKKHQHNSDEDKKKDEDLNIDDQGHINIEV